MGRARQEAMVEELRKAELVRDRLEGLDQIASAYPEGHDMRVLIENLRWTGCYKWWRRTSEPFGTPLSIRAAPKKPPDIEASMLAHQELPSVGQGSFIDPAREHPC